jgi:hypothetical protein
MAETMKVGVLHGGRSCGGGEEDLGGASSPSTLVAPEKHDTVLTHAWLAWFRPWVRDQVIVFWPTTLMRRSDEVTVNEKIVGDARTSEMDAIPEPFLPNQLDVGLTLLVELLGILHLLRLFITRTQQ